MIRDRPRVLVVGGTNFDIIVRAEKFPEEHEKLRGGECVAAPGGSAANTAVNLVRQGCAARLVSAVGGDVLGQVCVEHLQAAGVSTELVRVDPAGRTSMAIVMSSGAGKRMMTFAGADREAAMDAVSEQDVRSVDHVHAVGEPTPSLTRVMHLARTHGCSISLEWNGRDMGELAVGAALNFMNSDEAARLPRAVGADTAAAARLHARLLSGNMVITEGAKGAIWAAPDGRCVREPAVAVESVDRTGGGDAFNAGVIAGWLRGEAPVVCLRRGLGAASHVIRKMGAHP